MSSTAPPTRPSTATIANGTRNQAGSRVVSAPFFRSARIELIYSGQTPLEVRWSLRYQPYRDPPSHVGYFHATYRDHPNPEPGKDFALLDTRDTEGGGDWSGHLVGTSWIF